MPTEAAREFRKWAMLRWRVLAVWIVVFSGFVIWNQVDIRHAQQEGHKNRIASDIAIQDSQVAGCKRGNVRFTRLLDLAIASGAKADAEREGIAYKEALAKAKKKAAPFYKAAIIDCDHLFKAAKNT